MKMYKALRMKIRVKLASQVVKIVTTESTSERSDRTKIVADPLAQEAGTMEMGLAEPMVLLRTMAPGEANRTAKAETLTKAIQVATVRVTKAMAKAETINRIIATVVKGHHQATTQAIRVVEGLIEAEATV